jgi:hypothetical protein
MSITVAPGLSIADLGERALRRIGVAIIPVADRPPLNAMVAPASVATSALVELGVIAADETPSASDQALALAKVQAVQASLAAQALVWWDDAGIPSALVEEYTKLAAQQMATSFGKAGDLQIYTAIEARVRHVALVLSAPDLATAAVQAVHDNLAARGLVRWTVFDIPPAAIDPYVALAAAALAPRFDQQADPNAVVAATRSLAQIIALPTSGERVQVEYF